MIKASDSYKLGFATAILLITSIYALGFGFAVALGVVLYLLGMYE